VKTATYNLSLRNVNVFITVE